MDSSASYICLSAAMGAAPNSPFIGSVLACVKLFEDRLEFSSLGLPGRFERFASLSAWGPDDMTDGA